MCEISSSLSIPVAPHPGGASCAVPRGDLSEERRRESKFTVGFYVGISVCVCVCVTQTVVELIIIFPFSRFRDVCISFCRAVDRRSPCNVQQRPQANAREADQVCYIISVLAIPQTSCCFKLPSINFEQEDGMSRSHFTTSLKGNLKAFRRNLKAENRFSFIGGCC